MAAQLGLPVFLCCCFGGNHFAVTFPPARIFASNARRADSGSSVLVNAASTPRLRTFAMMSGRWP
ncbi:hypothetical protein [Bradyrhizobium cenepequi]|uniref:hypothetical protein n=1 Tax=Bradyrhizobium cenepequi TaxID=2821403 RepID=UPI001CE2FF78|nr:hypothetical protein [Bradyrhizobium cenepequi]MCA6109296.1 hypothetical protein [Bradyrhizobium cenepequi]